MLNITSNRGRWPHTYPYLLLAVAAVVFTSCDPAEDMSAPTAAVPATGTPTQAPSAMEEITSTPGPQLMIGSTLTSPKDEMIMVYVPGGEFSMGSESGFPDEAPVHRVFLDAYWIDQTEVTNMMYRTCVSEGACSAPTNLTYFEDTLYALHPVVYVTWEDADAYCSWAGRRLPTEAEWAKAATWNEQTEESYVYPWGNDFACGNGNFDDETNLDPYVVEGGENCDGYPTTAPVGSFSGGESPYGALDMAGNVWEWTADWYGEDYYANSPDSNPVGPAGGEERVLRGGSWYLDQLYVRSGYRYSLAPTVSSDFVGFRCALSEQAQ